ncbi:hypothetical protein STENOSP10_30260 [Stenotrophomonas sepilia]|uniref:Transmembrane protein n=1 Tax=Stenotrophomonas sepilia TaxID=2860290 RepID=A0ABQ6QFG5_9GAMM|nr:hypothetical protein STENOSP10_30260 [Stenotrophomonas sepilia]
MAYTRQEFMELRKQHNEMYDKFAYFLLAVTGAAIGFGIQKLDGLTMSVPSLICIAAVCVWVLSFYVGIRRIQATMVTLQINAEVATFLREDCESRLSQEQILKAERAATQALESSNRRNSRLMRAQLRLLIGGVLLFVAWRVLQMMGVN